MGVQLKRKGISMNKTSLILAFGLLLGACATTAKYDSDLNSLIGKSKEALIQQMGSPSAVKMLPNGDEVIAYTKANDVYVPSEFYLYNQGALSNEGDLYAPFLDHYDFSPYGGAFGYTVEYVCQTAFYLQGGRVVGWKWRGNDCASY